jgi:hypothetical protein
MDDPVHTAHFLPLARHELQQEVVGAERRVVCVIEDEVAAGQEVRGPGLEVASDALDGVVAVEPEERDRLRPARSDDFASCAQEADVAVRSRAGHVPEECGPVLRPELPASGADETIVWVDRIDRNAMTMLGTPCQGQGRAAAIASDLDDAPLRDPGSQVVEQECGIT